jgi:hypothetical protein
MRSRAKIGEPGPTAAWRGLVRPVHQLPGRSARLGNLTAGDLRRAARDLCRRPSRAAFRRNLRPYAIGILGRAAPSGAISSPARRRIDEAARHRLDPLIFDKNALLRFGLYVWISEQNASVNNLRLRGPSRIVCHGLFRPKLTIFCVTAPADKRSPPKCPTILDPGAKPDNMIVGRESRSGIAAVSGPGHAECLPGGRIAP